MMVQKILNNKFVFLIVIIALVGLHLTWEHFNGGIITHHLLAKDDMPGISNWWGLVTIPILTLITIFLVQNKYKNKDDKSGLSTVTIGFLRGLGFGVLIAVLWELKLENVLQYVILLPIVIAFFTPVHYIQNLLGFVLGMTFTFGGILPIGIGLFLVIASFLIWFIFRRGIPMLFKQK